MKKIVLSVSLVAMSLTSAFSQDVKPAAGDVAFGTSLQSPFASGSPFSLTNGGLNMRYFLSSDMAVRVGLNFTRNSNTKNFRDSVFIDIIAGGAKQLQEGTSNTASSMFDLRLGVEKHFTGTDKLDPYAGADLVLGFGSSSMKDEDYNSTTNRAEKGFMMEEKQGSTAFGLALVIGADYYVFPKVYLGTEFGWSFVATSVGEKTTNVSYIEPNQSGAGVVTTTLPEAVTAGSSSSKAGAGMSTAAFRVGFRF